MTIFIPLVAGAAGLVGGGAAIAAAYSRRIARQVERNIPPDGSFHTIRGRRLHVRDIGQGPAIVMIHGLAGQMRNFAAVVPLLAAGHRLVLIDRPGSGHSPGRGDDSLTDQAAIVAELIDRLGLDRPLIVGHSLLGLLWAGVFAIFVLFNWRSVVWPFLKKVLSITPTAVLRDLYEMGVMIAQLFGLLKSVKLPPAGRYNGAQRLLGTMIIASSMVIALTGTVMFVLFLFTPMIVDGAVFRWALVAHAFFVGLVYIGLVAHIYYSLIEEPEVLHSMVDGYLEEDYVKRHCPAWYDELKQQRRV